jgi:hypothetical protein
MKEYLLSAEDTARICHEANRAYCRAFGDTSQPPWDEAPDWQKESARDGVKAVFRNPDITPEESHKGWLEQKKANGWNYGAVKNPDTKEHPCMVPYGALPVYQRKKDEPFTAIARLFVAEVIR